MEITVLETIETKTMKAKDMPKGSIGRVKDTVGSELYVIRGCGNGDKYLCLWPNATPTGMEARSPAIVDNLDVTLLPKGSSIEFKF